MEVMLVGAYCEENFHPVSELQALE
jgi:hypothetical protein